MQLKKGMKAQRREGPIKDITGATRVGEDEGINAKDVGHGEESRKARVATSSNGLESRDNGPQNRTSYLQIA